MARLKYYPVNSKVPPNVRQLINLYYQSKVNT